MKKLTFKTGLKLKTIISTSLFAIGFSLSNYTNAQTTVNFNYSGSVQSWTVPAGVTSATITANGGAGGYQVANSHTGGNGTSISAVCNLTPGHTISIVTGGVGTASYWTAGGGGGTYVWDAASTTTPIMIAGGGGGASPGGNGGQGGTDIIGTPTNGTGGNAAGGSGGSGGGAGPDGGGANYGAGGGAGWLGNGGTDGYTEAYGGSDKANGFGGGSSSWGSGAYGGGGGGGDMGGGGGAGGYNGGGGGNGPSSGSGGGGGTYLVNTATIIGSPVANSSGSGSVAITYSVVCSLTTTATVLGESNCNYGGNASASPTNGTSPYTYTWSNGTSTVSHANPTGTILPAGSYTITVQDAGGCSASASVTITQVGTIVASWWSSKNISCFGGTNGQATSSVYGGNTPYTYTWSPNVSNTGTANNLSANTLYTMTVSDRYGCTSSISITLTQPAAALTETVTKNSDLTCHTINNGSATSNPSGGTSPYTYAWLPTGGTLKTSGTLPAGNDNCHVTDAHGCTATASVTLTAPAAINATFTRTNPTCNGTSNGSLTATGQNGTGGYAYHWAPYGGNAATATGLSAQTYTCTVTDNSGCTGVATVGLGQPALLAVTYTASICNKGKERATAIPSGGTGPYKYTWSNGSTSIADSLAAGTYTLTLNDAHNCPSASVTVVVSCPPSVIREKGKYNEGNNSSGNNLIDITVYPNPNKGQFTIAGLEQGQIIEMYDYTGRKISTISASDISIQINLSNELNGIYLIRILDKDGNLVGQKKIVKTN